jgi:hypothetical protein
MKKAGVRKNQVLDSFPPFPLAGNSDDARDALERAREGCSGVMVGLCIPSFRRAGSE